MLSILLKSSIKFSSSRYVLHTCRMDHSCITAANCTVVVVGASATSSRKGPSRGEHSSRPTLNIRILFAHGANNGCCEKVSGYTREQVSQMVHRVARLPIVAHEFCHLHTSVVIREWEQSLPCRGIVSPPADLSVGRPLFLELPRRPDAS